MNNLSIVGRIGKVGELRYTQGGKAVVNISVAVDNGKTSDGEKRAATWFEIALWEKQAEALAQYLVVGDRIGVNGQVRLQVDEGKDGQKYPKLTVDFPRVELLGSKPEAAQAAPRQAARPAQRQAAPTAVADYDPEVGF
jgi:single-strand DNA-binding protein